MERERLIAWVCDVALDQGGDWDGTFAEIRRDLTGEDLEQAELLALWILGNYEEPGLGPQVVRDMRDRRRRLIPVQPVQRRGWPWRATG
jgi:hypothetical protein